MGPCVPDPCNVDGATGEVCVEGECNCPDAPCPDGEMCAEGECMGRYFIREYPIKLVFIKGSI